VKETFSLDAIMDKEFYTENRRKLAVNLADDDLMLFFSGESVRKTADENYPFFTNRNFLYLTGIQQERTALLLHRRNGDLSATLFALPPDPAREVWTGRRHTWDELAELSGVTQIEDIDTLEKVLDGLLAARPAATLWLCFDALLPEHASTRSASSPRALLRVIRTLPSATATRWSAACARSRRLTRSQPSARAWPSPPPASPA
jgi:Xaa-Pro aminopeptidase